METEKERKLWKIAKKRVDFKYHLGIYLLTNAFFWAIWFFTDRNDPDNSDSLFPWPIWATLGWGIGLLFNYMDAYIEFGKAAIEREYEKLKNKT